jgi:hypothetical protein
LAGTWLEDRHEIVQQIVVQVFIDDAVHHVGADVADADRVAIGCGVRELAHGYGAGRPRDVVDDDLLAELLAHALAHDARHEIGRTAGRERHDHGDRLGGIGLGEGWAGQRDGKQSKGRSTQHS